MKEMSRQQKWQKKMRSVGRCIICGRPAPPGTLYCMRHWIEKHQGRKRTHYCKTIRALERLLLGSVSTKCQLCERPAVPGSDYCPFHLVQLHPTEWPLLQELVERRSSLAIGDSR